MLAAVGAEFAKRGDEVAVAAVVLAVLFSLMVTYTRARAEALGVECKVGIATRAVRVVIISAGLLFATGPGRLRAARAGHLRAGGAGRFHDRPADVARAQGAQPGGAAGGGVSRRTGCPVTVAIRSKAAL